MKITEIEYPLNYKKKYKIIHNKKRYTCYLDSWNGNLVVTGDGNTKNFKDITYTKLGTEIILKCHSKKFEKTT